MQSPCNDSPSIYSNTTLNQIKFNHIKRSQRQAKKINKKKINKHANKQQFPTRLDSLLKRVVLSPYISQWRTDVTTDDAIFIEIGLLSSLIDTLDR